MVYLINRSAADAADIAVVRVTALAL